MELHILANDIRSAENIGSIFRTCDSLGVTKLWITGYSPTPEHAKVAKTALGAEKSVEWEQHLDVMEVITDLKKKKFRIVGLELSDDAKNLSEYRAGEKIALLLGNERTGIPPSLLAACDDVVFIPQRGVKESLNVSVATGIAAFWLLNGKEVESLKS